MKFVKCKKIVAAMKAAGESAMDTTAGKVALLAAPAAVVAAGAVGTWMVTHGAGVTALMGGGLSLMALRLYEGISVHSKTYEAGKIARLAMVAFAFLGFTGGTIGGAFGLGSLRGEEEKSSIGKATEKVVSAIRGGQDGRVTREITDVSVFSGSPYTVSASAEALCRRENAVLIEFPDGRTELHLLKENPDRSTSWVVENAKGVNGDKLPCVPQ